MGSIYWCPYCKKETNNPWCKKHNKPNEYIG